MSIKKHAKHISHYIPLMGILVICVVPFVFFPYDTFFKGAVLVAAAIAYVVWGIIHHYIHKDLYPAVVIEYILVASLGLIVVLSLVFNA